MASYNTQRPVSDSEDESETSTVSQYTEVVAGQPRFFGCYLLESKSAHRLANQRSYVGFTVNPARRLRQHNGELKHGGARRTSKFRPWAMVAVVHGFACRIQALSFEWAWTNPARTRTLASHRGITRFSGTPHGRLRALAMLCSERPWRNCPLTLSVTTDRETWAKLIGSGADAAQIPSTLRVEFRDKNNMGDLARYDYRAGAVNAARPTEKVGGGCMVCEAPVGGDAPQARAQCAHCGVLSCLSCIAECEATEADEDKLVPDKVFCSVCHGVMDWAIVVRLSRALAAEAAAAEDAILNAGGTTMHTSVPV